MVADPDPRYCVHSKNVLDPNFKKMSNPPKWNCTRTFRFPRCGGSNIKSVKIVDTKSLDLYYVGMSMELLYIEVCLCLRCCKNDVHSRDHGWWRLGLAWLPPLLFVKVSPGCDVTRRHCLNIKCRHYCTTFSECDWKNNYFREKTN